MEDQAAPVRKHPAQMVNHSAIPVLHWGEGVRKKGSLEFWSDLLWEAGRGAERWNQLLFVVLRGPKSFTLTADLLRTGH